MCVALKYRALFLILFGLLLLLRPALASSEEAGPLTLAEAIERALAGNPTLGLPLHERRIQEGRLRQAEIGPRVGLDLEMENFLGSGFYDGFSHSETTLSLIWVLERGKRQHRVTAAQAAVTASEVSAELRRLEVAADTADAFLEVLVDQERLALAGEAVRLGEEARMAVAERVRVGRSPALELARAEADLAWQRLAEDDVAHELLVSRRLLSSHWGADVSDFSAVTGSLQHQPVVASYPELMQRIAASPQINQYLTRGRVRQAELALAEAQSKQDWLLRTGARYLGLTDDFAFVAGITLPVGRANPNPGQIDSARAELALADATLVARRLEIETAIFRLHQELTHNVRRAAAIDSEIIPLLESVVAEAGAAYSAGRFSYFELRQAQVALLDCRLALLEESYLSQINRIAIERLTGTAVSVRETGVQTDKESS